MPAYIGAATSLYRLSGQQAGLLSGGESLTIAASCMVASLLISRVGWKLLAACALFCILGDLASNIAHGFHQLFAIRLLTGLLGEGPLYACSYAVLGMARKSDRAYAWALILSVVVGAAMLAAQPALQRLASAGLLLPFVVASAALIPALRWLPALGAPADHQRTDEAARPTHESHGLLLAIAVWFGAPGLCWAFAEAVGTSRGLPVAQVDQALALATVFGLIGLAAPVVFEDRFGRVVPVLVATVIVIAAAVASVAASHFAALVAALSLFYIGWNIASVYQLSALAKSDSTGRYAGLGALAQLVGLSVGPPIAGALLDRIGYAAIPICVAAFSGIGGVIFVGARWVVSSRPARQAVPASH